MYISKILQSFSGSHGDSRAQQSTVRYSKAQRGQSLALGCSAKSLTSLSFRIFSVKGNLAKGSCE